MGTNDYQHAAARYALREITGTDAIAFHGLAERFATLGLSGKALDLGCGSGRSTRFLKALKLQTVGLDVSESMIAEARKRDPDGTYLSYHANEPLPFEEASFDVLLSAWVVLELRSRAYLDTFLGEVARVLKLGAKGFIVTNTSDFYQHRWVSCEVDFPENKPPLQAGQHVKARLMPEGVVVTDIFWSDAVYQEALAGAGLHVVHGWYPKASAAEGHWLDETKVAPWVIYEVERAH